MDTKRLQQERIGRFKFGSSTGGSGLSFGTFPRINIEYVSGEVTGNITLSSKGNTGKKAVIEDVEDDIDELHYSYFSKPP